MRVWPTLAAWGIPAAASIPLAAHAFGGGAATLVAVVLVGSVVGTTDVWGRVEAAERARRARRARVEV